MVGSMRSLRSARSRAGVRSSSASASRLKPTTSAARIAVALDAGFGDLSTFNRRLRETFGVTPTRQISSRRVRKTAAHIGRRWASELKVLDARPEWFAAARLAPDRRYAAAGKERQAAKVAHHRAAMAERGEKLVEKRQAAAIEFIRIEVAPGRSASSRILRLSHAQLRKARGTPRRSV